MPPSSRQLIRQLTESPVELYTHTGVGGDIYRLGDVTIYADRNPGATAIVAKIRSRAYGVPVKRIKFDARGLSRFLGTEQDTKSFEDSWNKGPERIRKWHVLYPAIKSHVDKLNAEASAKISPVKVKRTSDLTVRDGYVSFDNFDDFLMAVDGMKIARFSRSLAQALDRDRGPGDVIKYWSNARGKSYLVMGSPEKQEKAERTLRKLEATRES